MDIFWLFYLFSVIPAHLIPGSGGLFDMVSPRKVDLFRFKSNFHWISSYRCWISHFSLDNVNRRRGPARSSQPRLCCCSAEGVSVSVSGKRNLKCSRRAWNTEDDLHVKIYWTEQRTKSQEIRLDEIVFASGWGAKTLPGSVSRGLPSDHAPFWNWRYVRLILQEKLFLPIFGKSTSLLKILTLNCFFLFKIWKHINRVVTRASTFIWNVEFLRQLHLNDSNCGKMVTGLFLKIGDIMGSVLAQTLHVIVTVQK